MAAEARRVAAQADAAERARLLEISRKEKEAKDKIKFAIMQKIYAPLQKKYDIPEIIPSSTGSIATPTTSSAPSKLDHKRLEYIFVRFALFLG